MRITSWVFCRFGSGCPWPCSDCASRYRAGVWIAAAFAAAIVCMPVAAAGDSGPAPRANSAELLKAHNRYRRALNLPPLQWSSELAASAQQWAAQLAQRGVMTHSSGAYGENIWAGTRGAYTQTQMVDGWGSEQQYFVPGRKFPQSCTGNWMKCAHYTQMIWRNTRKLGCGLAAGKGMTTLVCQYSPPGNYQGQLPY